MYEISCVHKRHFAVRFCKRRLDLEPPKLKTINKLLHMIKHSQREDSTAMQEMTPLIAQLLSKNKQNFKVSAAMVEDGMDWDDVIRFLTAMFAWLNEEKKDPN